MTPMTPITRNPSPTLRPTRKALRLDMARRAASTRAPLPHPHPATPPSAAAPPPSPR